MEFEEAVTGFEEFFAERWYDEVTSAVRAGDEDVQVDMQAVDEYNLELMDMLRSSPEDALDAAEEAVNSLDVSSSAELSVRFDNPPEEDFVLLRNLRSKHIGRMVPVAGMIKRASQVKPEVVSATFECQSCAQQVVKEQDSTELKSPYKCESCGSRKFQPVEKQMTDTQAITLEESPDEREGSEQPSTLSVRLEGDLTDPDFQRKVIPGNEAVVVGEVKERPLKKKSKKFDMYMDANNLVPTQQEFEELELTEGEIEDIEEMASEPDIFDRIIDSIAPSIFGHRQVKKAIALQLFGGVKKTREDGVKSRGDIHILLIGEPGTGKSQLLQFAGELAPKGRYVVGKSSTGAGLCVTGDTLVATEEGIRPIEDIVEREISYPVSSETATSYDGRLYSYGEDGIELEDGSAMWRMPPKQCRRITTSYGKHIEASENTDVLTAGKNGVEWKKISEIDEGDYVAAPRRLDVEIQTPECVDFFDFGNEKLKLSDESISYLRSEMTERYGSLRTAAEELGLSESFVYTSMRKRYIPYRRLQYILSELSVNKDEVELERAMLRNGHDFRIPSSFDEDMMYLLGLVFGDGDINISQDTGRVRLSNSNEEILNEAKSIISEKFDRDPDIERQEGKVPYIRLGLRTVATFFSNTGMASPKKGLEIDYRLTTAENADAFLRGLMDADGCVVNREGGSDSVQLSTISGRLAEQVQLMLETFGVRAKKRERDRRDSYERADGQHIETRPIQHHLEITGSDIDTYKEKIGFSTQYKSQELEEITGKQRNPNKDTIPDSELLEDAETKPGRHWSYFNQSKNPSRERARQIVREVELEESTRRRIQQMAGSDLSWEQVVETEETGEKELYDLTVPDTHNFIGNGIVTHNTASVVKEESTGEFSLEAGAVVLAHKGMAAIDEIDKMDKQDRSSLHEAMEQQCFAPQTQVQLGDGRTKNIEDIVEPRIAELEDRSDRDRGAVVELENGVELVSSNLGGDIGTAEASVAGRREAPERMLEIQMGNGRSLEVTPDHPFYTVENGEIETVEARKLDRDSFVLAPRKLPIDGEEQELDDIDAEKGRKEVDTPEELRDDLERVEKLVENHRFLRVEDIDSKEPDYDYVYDLTVPDKHNFVAEGAVVHNSISVSKANIQATLNAETAILAAGNPKLGRFDPYEPIPQQIEIGDTLLSRFDFIFPVKDEPDEDRDRKLSEQVLKNHIEPEESTAEVSADMLRKYIAYSRRIRPDLTDEAAEVIQEFYVDMRKKGGGEEGSSVPITARQLEALVRIAEASARAELSEEVTEDDAERAVDILTYCLEQVGVDPETGEYDIDMVESGVSGSQRNRQQTVKQIINEATDRQTAIEIEEVLDRADDQGVDRQKAEEIINRMQREGDLFEPEQGKVQKI
ncbi:hypothetical protein GLU01_00420 [Nanohaloarchaea archaeon]|nr:hypothetical protein [Candidatus Nanohaloarchaea archaeon]